MKCNLYLYPKYFKLLFLAFRSILGITFFCIFWSSPTYAWSWQDLWETPDHQAQTHMQTNDYVKAEKKFKRLDWRAAAAYRAGHYQEAASLYQLLHDQEGFYNLGNTLAHLGQYEKAVQAYDKVITLNPKHQDALHNREIVKSLLEKQQSQNNQNKQNQEKQQNQNQDQNNPSSSNTKQETQPQESSQQNTTQNTKNNTETTSQPQEKQADANASESENKRQADQPEQNTQPNQENAASNQPLQAEQEQQQANAQWLRLIPDDPGGLLKEKFKRDYLRRQNR